MFSSHGLLIVIIISISLFPWICSYLIQFLQPRNTQLNIQIQHQQHQTEQLSTDAFRPLFSITQQKESARESERVQQDQNNTREQSEDLPAAQSVIIALPAQWLVFGSHNCRPCVIAKHDYLNWLTASGWEVSADSRAHIRLMDESQTAIHQKYQVHSYPTFILLQQGKVIERHTTYPGKEYLARAYNAAIRHQTIHQQSSQPSE